MVKALIAVGHGRRSDGTFDPGATDGEHSEQRDGNEVARFVVRELRLHAPGHTWLHEVDQDDPNYSGTTAQANRENVDAVVSIHFDWSGAPLGAFSIQTSDDGRRLGFAIEARVEEAGFAIRDYPDDRDNLYLLNNTRAPAVIFECGRIGSAPIDEPEEWERMGRAIGRGILDYFGIPLDDGGLSMADIDDIKADLDELKAMVRRRFHKNTEFADWLVDDGPGGAQVRYHMLIKQLRRDAFDARQASLATLELVKQIALDGGLTDEQVDAIVDRVSTTLSAALADEVADELAGRLED